MTTAVRQEISLLVLAVTFTVGTISLALWGRPGDAIDTLLMLLRIGVVVSWIVLTIVVGTNRVMKQVQASAAQVRTEVEAARELALREIHMLYKRLGDEVAAREFERRLTEAEEGKSGGLTYLRDHGLQKGARNT